MKICEVCGGRGEVNFEICETCGGEGIDGMSTFTVGKIQRRKSAELEFEEKAKKLKFDKKNAQRNLN